MKRKMNLFIWILLFLVQSTITLAGPLLKVPKVYNALITTDQNLSPSRAFPVIQPVVHRTAIGYSPPFYYQPGSPGYGGGYGPNYPEFFNPPVTEQSGRSNPENNPDVESLDVEQPNSSKDDDKVDEFGCKVAKKQTNDRVPLNFYPNYRSLYYDPYLYAFNSYPAFPTPGNYYFNYQQPNNYPPLGPDGYPQVPGYQPFPGAPGPMGPPQADPPVNNDKKEDTRKEEEEKKEDVIPDVPPPPVPARRAVNKTPQ